VLVATLEETLGSVEGMGSTVAEMFIRREEKCRTLVSRAARGRQAAGAALDGQCASIVEIPNVHGLNAGSKSFMRSAAIGQQYDTQISSVHLCH
jgi:hypothetical protein